jgi:tetratricopeptide (TPR) repeat protein
LENQQYATALADANRALQIAPGDARALVLRSQILQHLGRHSDAIQDWQQLVVMAENGLAVSLTEALNGRAYARALGGVELKEALDDVEEALRRAGDNAAMLDTRGFIHCQLGSTAAALADLDKSVRLAEEGHEEYSRNLNNGRLGAVDPREYELGLKQLAETVAVIRYHRALVYAKLGKQELQDQDEQRVRELGFAPNQDLF